MSDRCFCFWRGLNTTQKELHEKITMKKRSSTTVLKNDSYKRYHCKSGMYLQQFNTHASKNHRKATNTMCTVYFDIWLRENTTSIYVKCESNVDFNSGVCNCLIILLHIHVLKILISDISFKCIHCFDPLNGKLEKMIREIEKDGTNLKSN